jgi:hypothetical protein
VNDNAYKIHGEKQPILLLSRSARKLVYLEVFKAINFLTRIIYL